MTPTEIAAHFFQHIADNLTPHVPLPDSLPDIIAPKTFTFCLDNMASAGTMRLAIVLFSDDNIHIEDFTTQTGFKKVTQTTLRRLHDDLAKQPFVLSLSQQQCFRHMLTKHHHHRDTRKATSSYHY